MQASLFRGYRRDPVACVWIYPIVVASDHCVGPCMVMDCDHWHSLCYLLSMELEVIMSEVKFYSCDIVGGTETRDRQRRHRCICPVCKLPTEVIEEVGRGIVLKRSCYHSLGASFFDPVVVVCFRMGKDQKDVWGA